MHYLIVGGVGFVIGVGIGAVGGLALLFYEFWNNS